MYETQVEMKALFPNLIIYLGENSKRRTLVDLKKNFSQCNYGPLYTRQETDGLTCILNIMCGEECLASGKGLHPIDAEEDAVSRLMAKLKASCYVIEANPSYFTRKRVPACALNVDSSFTDILRVVCLKNNRSGTPFPHPLSGAVHYVESYEELMDYIETHGKSDSKADLFILNIEKCDRKMIINVCQKNNLQTVNLIGCSDRGIKASRKQNPQEIVEDLLKCGGKNIKYQLVGPKDRFHGDVKEEEEDTHGMLGIEIFVVLVKQIDNFSKNKEL